MTLLHIENNGTEIISTNYWTSDWAQRGLIVASVNAGEVRLLVPDAMSEVVAEAGKCAYIVVSKGSSKQYGRIMYEIMFEDHSDNPYALFLDERQFVDMQIPDEYIDNGKFQVSIWMQYGKQSTKDAYYRKVDDIPCLAEYKVK